MKRRINVKSSLIAILALLMLLCTGCNKEVEPEPEETDKAIVVVFSITGNTRRIALQIAETLNADYYEIEAAVPYTEADLKYGDDDCRSSKERDDASSRPEIKGEKVNLEDYDTVYLGYPIWHGEAPRILYTFVEMYDLEGKTIVPFCTSDASPVGSSSINLAEVANGGSWKDGIRFEIAADENTIKAWLDEVNK